LITRNLRRRHHLATAVLAAIPLGLAIPLTAPTAASAAETCVQTGFGSTGWTGNITATPSTGWSTGGAGNWTNSNDTAIGQILEHPVTGFPATGATLEFDVNWKQAGSVANSSSARLHVLYNGTEYALVETPGPNNQAQFAITTTSAGGVLSPAFPSRPTGLAPQTTMHFTLTLPAGVPADGTLRFSMSWTNANGIGAAGADDFTVSNVSALQCEPTIGDPLFDPAVATGALAASAVVFFGLRRLGQSS